MSDRIEQGQRIPAALINELTDGKKRVDHLNAAGGARASVGPHGITISGKTDGFKLIEPAIECFAHNAGATDLDMYSVCGITGVMNDTDPELARIINVRVPTADDKGRFAVCAEPIPAGQVGRVIIMGATLAMVRNQSNLKFCDIESSQQTLKGASSGGAQILWPATFAGAAAQLALIRFPFGGAGSDTGCVGVKAAGTVLATPLDGIAIADGERVLMTAGVNVGVHLRQSGAWVSEGHFQMVGVAQGTANGRRLWFYNGATYVESFAGILGTT